MQGQPPHPQPWIYWLTFGYNDWYLFLKSCNLREVYVYKAYSNIPNARIYAGYATTEIKKTAYNFCTSAHTIHLHAVQKRTVFAVKPKTNSFTNNTVQHNILIKFCCLWRIEMTQQQHMGLLHRLINYIETKAKCRHLKKYLTLRQVFLRVYRLEIQSVMLFFFRPSFVNCCPSNLFSGSTLSPFSVWISILYTRI